ncbi:MAG: DUF2141 domain-containing protein [Hymenobacter sp.]
MNFLQIPKEPVGFGNNYKPFGEPKFESALIDSRPDRAARRPSSSTSVF